MKIAIGSDHRGFEHKKYIQKLLVNYEWIDVGCFTPSRCDYPEFAKIVVDHMLSGLVQRGILLCGTGIGMAIAANRYTGMYAGLVWNSEIACRSRQEDNTNIICLPCDFVSLEESVSIINTWLSCEFKQGRYLDRLKDIDN